jgi:hypothetical protein
MQKRPLVCVDWQDAPGTQCTTLWFCYTVQNFLMFMVVGNWLIFSISLTNLFFCCCVYYIHKVMRCSNYWTGVTSRAQCFTTYSTHCSSACLCYISTGGFSSFAWLLSKLKPEAESQMTSALVPMSLLTQLLVIHVCCNKLQILPSWLVLEQFTLDCMTLTLLPIQLYQMMTTVTKRIETKQAKRTPCKSVQHS